jgi:HEAT repeat protein
MRHFWKLGLPALVLVAAWCLAAPVRAEALKPDPVEQLRKGLKAIEDLRADIRLKSVRTDEAGRKIQANQLKAMEDQVEALAKQVTTIGELRRALQLRELTNIPLDPGTADFNQRIWNMLADRFFPAIKEAVKDRTNPVRELAVVNLISEMATAAQASTLESAGLQQRLSELGEALIARTGPEVEPRVREAAIRALGKINPTDPKAAATTLDSVLFGSPPSGASERRAAAEALGNLILGLTQALNSTSAQIRSARGLSRVGAPKDAEKEIERLRNRAHDLAEAIGRYVDEAGRALADGDDEVRRLASAAFGQVAIGLENLDVPLPESDEPEEEYQKELAKEREALEPLLTKLRDRSDAMARAINDPDVEVRTQARRAVENLALTREKLLRPRSFITPPPSLPPGPPSEQKKESRLPASGRRDVTATAAADAPKEDTLQQGLTRRPVLEALARGLTDPDMQARLAAVAAIEALGKDAIADDVPQALVRTLLDCNIFVRWAAARTLGKMAQGEKQPVAVETAVPGLVRLLNDPDLDVRLTAALSLGRYGPAAIDAATALARSVTTGDVEMRIAAITALEGIGTKAAGAAIPVLTRALAEPDPRLQRAAAHSLGRYADAGIPLGPEAIAALRRALNDPDPDVRRLASDALLSARP